MMTEQEQMACRALEKFDTPTISNALECFPGYDRRNGFMDPAIKSVIVCSKTYIGPAATAKIGTKEPPTDEEKEKLMPYLAHVREIGPGCIVVQQDIDDKIYGSYWGEVNVTMHQALGCSGVITSGGVRDLNEIEKMSFGYFAKEVVVSHVYAHIADFACKVIVGGLEILPGDIIACDRHGVIKIPREWLIKLEPVCRRIAEAELPVLENCRRALMRGEIVSLDELSEWRQEMAKARKEAAER